MFTLWQVCFILKVDQIDEMIVSIELTQLEEHDEKKKIKQYKIWREEGCLTLDEGKNGTNVGKKTTTAKTRKVGKKAVGTAKKTVH